MITRQVRFQLIAFLVIALVGLTYTGLRYAGLGRFFVDQGYVVSANFADSGGIFKGAEVTYRGVTSGKVTQLKLLKDGVQVDLRLNPGLKVPANTRAVVGNRSAVGEQFVDLQPQTNGTPFLKAGDDIPRSRTSIPVSPKELIVNLDDFVTSINLKDLGTTLDELGKAFNDAGPSLQTIVDDGNTLTRAALDNLPQTKTLIDDGKTALDTQRDVSGQFKSFNADLAKLTQTLRTSDPDFRRLYTNGGASAAQLTDLIRKNRSDLPILLDNLITFADIQKVRLPAIRQILVTYPNVVAGGFTVVPGDGTTHFGSVNDSTPTVCEQGYGGTNKRPPSDTSRRTPNMNAGCTLPRGSTSDVRGALKARQAGEAASRGGTQGSRVPSTGDSSNAGYTTMVGGYEPRTGGIVTNDGKRFTVSSSAGAEQRFGKDSWQWLLLGPLTK